MSDIGRCPNCNGTGARPSMRGVHPDDTKPYACSDCGGTGMSKVDGLSVVGHHERAWLWQRSDDDMVGVQLSEPSASQLAADFLTFVEVVPAGHLTGAVEAERARIVARIRREASETFDLQLDVEFRRLAQLIEERR